MTKMQDDELDRLLARAASMPQDASSALMDRVLADALALQPTPPDPARQQPASPRPGFLAWIAGAIGGAPALGAVTAAAVCGIALGYLSPGTIDALASSLIESGAEDFFPSVDFLTTEG